MLHGAGLVGIAMYYLFQHHTLPTERQAPLYGELSGHLFTQVNERIAVVAVDARSERTTEQIVPQSGWDFLFRRMHEHWRPGTRHLLFVVPVPIIFPRMHTMERVFGCMSKVLANKSMAATFFRKTGAAKLIASDFDEPGTCVSSRFPS